MSGAPYMDEAALPDPLKRGLAAIRAAIVPDASVIAIDGNFLYIAVGTMTKDSLSRAESSTYSDAELPARYSQDQVRLFARVSRNFPSAESYGVLTLPFLTRVDSVGIPWQHANHGSAQPLAAAIGVSDIGFWSWDWSGMPARQGEDLVAVVEWARKCVRVGAL